MVLTALLSKPDVISFFLQFKNEQWYRLCYFFQFRLNAPIISDDDFEIVSVTPEGRGDESTCYMHLWCCGWKPLADSNDELNMIFEVRIETNIDFIRKHYIMSLYSVYLKTSLAYLLLDVVSHLLV